MSFKILYPSFSHTHQKKVGNLAERRCCFNQWVKELDEIVKLVALLSDYPLISLWTDPVPHCFPMRDKVATGQWTIYVQVTDANKCKALALFYYVLLKASLSLKLTGVMFSPTALKKVFAQDKEIQEMAQNNFIMLNLMVQKPLQCFLNITIQWKVCISFFFLFLRYKELKFW